jgi:CheY-like chemotaxis protein
MAPPQENKASTVKQVRILMAEDNEVNRKLVSLLLKRFGFELETAEDGEEALRKLAGTEKPFHCLLLDLKMPGMDGYEVARVLRKERKDPIPIIALTADTSEEERKKCMELGMDDFLSKPFEPSLLYNKITKLVGVERSFSNDHHPAEEETGGALNLRYLSEITQGDAEQQRQLAEVFRVNTPRMLQELQHYFSEGRYEEMRKLAHKIRSGASVMLTSGPIRLLHQIEYTPPGAEMEENLGEKIRLFTHLCGEALEEIKKLNW